MFNHANSKHEKFFLKYQKTCKWQTSALCIEFTYTKDSFLGGRKLKMFAYILRLSGRVIPPPKKMGLFGGRGYVFLT
jgi:hypothetical protein